MAEDNPELQQALQELDRELQVRSAQYDHTIFLLEDLFKSQKSRKGTSPRKGKNASLLCSYDITHELSPARGNGDAISGPSN